MCAQTNGGALYKYGGLCGLARSKKDYAEWTGKIQKVTKGDFRKVKGGCAVAGGRVDADSSRSHGTPRSEGAVTDTSPSQLHSTSLRRCTAARDVRHAAPLCLHGTAARAFAVQPLGRVPHDDRGQTHRHLAPMTSTATTAV
jgi:hypothetical protein